MDATAAAITADFKAGTAPPSTNAPPELSKLLQMLRPFQKDAFEFATKKCEGRILLADEMGLGKTVTSLSIMTAYMSEWPLLILCPASLRHTWPSEIEKFLPSVPPSAMYVVSGFDDADFHSNPTKRARIRIVVATYSLLQNRSAAAKVLDEFDFRCVIADESHNLKERTSQRCKLALPLLKKARRLCLLSGTPALARPVELWAQLHCLDPKLFGSFTAYTKKYCNAHRGRFGWDVKGISNEDELHSKLRTVMIRRLKSDVLKDLPPKQRTIVPVKIGREHAGKCRDLMQDMAATRLSVSELAGEDAAGAHFEARKLLMQAYQATGIAKAGAVSDYLLDWLVGSGTQKILVFAHHRDVLDVLEAALSRKMKGVGHIRIDGEVPPSERAVRVRKFQNEARVRVALLSVTAAGVGLTLTAASSVIFAELHWTPGVLAQAEDRCHRIGQHNAVNVMYFVSKETELSVDMSLLCMLGKKIGNLGRLIDGNKSASLNARELEGGGSGDGPRSGGISAEDELTSFFADTSPTSAATPVSSQPVKGSIESFFTKKRNQGEEKKRPKQSDCSTDRKINSVTPSEKSWKPFGSGRNTLSSSSSSRRVEELPTPHSNPTSTITWSCNACTFINTKTTSRICRILCCEICGTQMIEEDYHDSSITTSAQSKPQSSTRTGKQIPLHGTVARTVSPTTSSSKDVIEVCDGSSSDECDGGNKKIANRSSAWSDDGIVNSPAQKQGRRTSPKTDGCKTEQKPDLLSFSVSKNSGRIAIHIAKTNEPLNANFDVEQVISDATTDCLLQMKIKRITSKEEQLCPSKASVSFDAPAVMQVVELLDRGLISKARVPYDTETFCFELKSFVSSFLSLREVEKKLIKDWGNPETPSSLRSRVAVLLSTTASSTTDRYSGGMKERATENAKNNCATELEQAVLRGEACAWCAKYLSGASLARGVESTYCSQKCAEDGRLRRGGMYASTRVRAQVFALEGGVCRICGIDAHALFLRISSLQPAERLNALCNANWKMPQSSQALERLLQRPKEGDFWQADHIRAVAEGGGSCGLENLQTLCTPCHKTETEKLRARLRLNGGAAALDCISNSSPNQTMQTGQMDIRAAFFEGVAPADQPRKRRKRSAD